MDREEICAIHRQILLLRGEIPWAHTAWRLMGWNGFVLGD